MTWCYTKDNSISYRVSFFKCLISPWRITAILMVGWRRLGVFLVLIMYLAWQVENLQTACKVKYGAFIFLLPGTQTCWYVKCRTQLGLFLLNSLWITFIHVFLSLLTPLWGGMLLWFCVSEIVNFLAMDGTFLNTPSLFIIIFSDTCPFTFAFLLARDH